MKNHELTLEPLEKRLLLTGLPELNIIPTVINAVEQGSVAGEFTITRSGSTEDALTVQIALGGSAVNGQDYGLIDSAIEIPAGASEAKLLIDPIADDLIEGNETIVAVLAPDDAYTIGDRPADTIILVDGDGAGQIEPDPPEPVMLYFGNVEGDRNVKAEHQGVTYSLRGPGTGMLTLKEDGRLDLTFVDTTTRSNARLKVTRHATSTIDDILVNGSINRVDMRDSNLIGNYTSLGSTKKWRVDQVLGDNVISVGLDNTRTRMSIEAETIRNMRFTSQIPLNKVDIGLWENTDNIEDYLIAPHAAKIKADNLLRVDINLTDVRGKRSLTKLDVRGMVSESTIRTAGHIAKVDLGGMSGSQVLVGLNNVHSGPPEDIEDFSNAKSTIRNIRLHGLRGLEWAFVDSVIAAGRLKKVDLDSVKAENNGATFGVYADQINSLQYLLGKTSTRHARMDAPITSTTQEDFQVQLLAAQ
jgi:hypothetical protein